MSVILTEAWLMATRFLIIDGYNLLHAAGLARAQYGPGDLARQRHALLFKLARRLMTDERQRCTVVFDALDAPPNLQARFKHEEMTVLFAMPGQEADEVIERLVSQHSAPRRLTVVSSDHRLQTAISRRRGIGIDSEVFLKQLESPQRQIGPVQRPAGPSSSTDQDLGFWLREFEEISPEKLNAEVIAQSGEKKTDWDQQIESLQKRIQDPEGLEEWLDQSSNMIPAPSPQSKKKGKNSR